MGTSGHRTAGLETIMVLTDILTAAFRALLQANNRIMPSSSSLILTHFSRSDYTGGNEWLYLGADKSLARPTSRCILFDGENISFDASLVLYIYSTNIPPIVIINRIYEHRNVLSL